MFCIFFVVVTNPKIYKDLFCNYFTMDEQNSAWFGCGYVAGFLTAVGAVIALKHYDSPSFAEKNKMNPPNIELPTESVPAYETPLSKKILEFNKEKVERFNRFEGLEGDLRDLQDNPLPIWNKGNFWI